MMTRGLAVPRLSVVAVIVIAAVVAVIPVVVVILNAAHVLHAADVGVASGKLRATIGHVDVGVVYIDIDRVAAGVMSLEFLRNPPLWTPCLLNESVWLGFHDLLLLGLLKTRVCRHCLNL